MLSVIPTVIVGAVTGLLRNVAGWAENALEDGEVSDYEWGQLGATVVKTIILTASLHYGLGLDNLASAAGAVALDFIIRALKS